MPPPQAPGPPQNRVRSEESPSSDPPLRARPRYSALAIGNIAMDPRGRLSVLSSPDAMFELARLLGSQDTESVR